MQDFRHTRLRIVLADIEQDIPVRLASQLRSSSFPHTGSMTRPCLIKTIDSGKE